MLTSATLFFFCLLYGFIHQIRQDFDQYRYGGGDEDLGQKQQEQALVGRQISVFVRVDARLSDHDMVEQKVGVAVCGQHIDHFHKMRHLFKQSFQSQEDEEGPHGQDHDRRSHIDGQFGRIEQIEPEQRYTDGSGPFWDTVHHLHQKHAQDKVIDLDREIIISVEAG